MPAGRSGSGRECWDLPGGVVAVSDHGTLGGLTQFATQFGVSGSAARPQTIDSKRRDVRVVEGARLEIALTVCDGVLQISITVADPES